MMMRTKKSLSIVSLRMQMLLELLYRFVLKKKKNRGLWGLENGRSFVEIRNCQSYWTEIPRGGICVCSSDSIITKQKGLGVCSFCMYSEAGWQSAISLLSLLYSLYFFF
jgi:hypothetical protein